MTDKNSILSYEKSEINSDRSLKELLRGALEELKADPAGFEPATLGLGGPRPIHARLRVRVLVVVIYLLYF